MAVEVHEGLEVAVGRWEAAAAADPGRVAVGAAWSAGGGGEGSNGPVPQMFEMT